MCQAAEPSFTDSLSLVKLCTGHSDRSAHVPGVCLSCTLMVILGARVPSRVPCASHGDHQSLCTVCIVM